MATKTKTLFSPRTLPLILVRTCHAVGYWGKGETLGDAIAAARWITRGTAVYVCQVSADAFVNEAGHLVANERGPIFSGFVNAQRNGLRNATKVTD